MLPRLDKQITSCTCLAYASNLLIECKCGHPGASCQRGIARGSSPHRASALVSPKPGGRSASLPWTGPSGMQGQFHLCQWSPRDRFVSIRQNEDSCNWTASCACYLSNLDRWVSPHRMAEPIRVTSLVIHANDHLSSLSAAFDNLHTCHCVVLAGNSNSISLFALRNSCLVGSHGTMAEQLHCHAATPRQHS